MATALQIKALLKSIQGQDTDRFKSIAMQIVADEFKKGHSKFAEDIKKIIEDTKLEGHVISKPTTMEAIPLAYGNGELEGLFEVCYSKLHVNDLIMMADLRNCINRLITEYKFRNKLREFNLSPRNKILMVGPPGTGKTMTASAIAGSLQLPIFTIQLDRLLTKYLGETASRLRLIFEHINKFRGVYFFDEFDALGSNRSLNNDVGEIRRILNTFLQFVEQATTDSIILAATNYPQLLDKALFRRFDDILQYQLPNAELRLRLLKLKLSDLPRDTNWACLVEKTNNLNFDDISKICDNIHKYILLDSHDGQISEEIIMSIIAEKQTNNQL